MHLISPAPTQGNAAVAPAQSLHEQAANFAALKRSADMATAAAKAAQAPLLARMQVEGILSVRAVGAVVSVIPGSGGTTIDGAAAEIKIGELASIIDLLAGRLAQLGEDVVLPEDLGSVPLKISTTSASLRCKAGA